ncbi:hypothetical protein N0V91_005756 [Didymella pomorum]|uniref:Uncharacterized protein n=1 Tax=Didymella pomorum TaxID=749634 RepID=A0A9W8ZDY5_9PLEO|nr:hypothetical protein N0V91_005756 [Didymella pomorum]
MPRNDDVDERSRASLSRHRKIDFDLSVLDQLSVYSGLKKPTDDGLRPGFDPEVCYKESFAKEVSRIGRLLVNKGTEKMMPFEQYWAQYDEVPEVERFSHWEYTIEK